MKRFRSATIGPWVFVFTSLFFTLALAEIGLRLLAPQYGNYVRPDDQALVPCE